MQSGNFRSDNESGAAPEILDAVVRAATGSAHSYGEDALTERVRQRFCELFECELDVFPVATGTAANALCVAHLAPVWGEIYCHAHSHLNTDECGAPEFYSGGKLYPLAGEGGKIDAAALAERLEGAGELGDHVCEPAVLSISESTEFGRVYTPSEVAELTGIARKHGLRTHMDGARFGNAVASLGCSPADLSWRAGIDMLSFGATKNGALGAEAIVVFRREMASGLGRRRKRAGHLLSKMRFVSAQLEAYVCDDLWLRLARHSNRAAARLSAGLSPLPGVELLYPVEANEVFVRFPDAVHAALAAAGFEFHRWPGTRDVYRMVTAFNSTDEAIDAFIAAATRGAGAG